MQTKLSLSQTLHSQRSISAEFDFGMHTSGNWRFEIPAECLGCKNLIVHILRTGCLVILARQLVPIWRNVVGSGYKMVSSL